jgi:ribosomal protein L23
MMGVAAIDKSHFQVSNYLTKDEIKSNMGEIYNIFPKAVCEKIKEKI